MPAFFIGGNMVLKVMRMQTDRNKPTCSETLEKKVNCISESLTQTSAQVLKKFIEILQLLQYGMLDLSKCCSAGGESKSFPETLKHLVC